MVRLQPSPLCNLNCSYCYIPAAARRSSERMSLDIVRTIFSRLIDEDLLGETLSVSWHGGEPMAAGLQWYESALALIDEVVGARTRISHVIQTNGTLLSARWCEFIAAKGISIGVSIDGPAAQSEARVDWAGRTAHSRVMRGVQLLNDHEIAWTLLAVVGRSAMQEADAFIAFVKASRCAALGFKVEETNVANRSSLENQDDIFDLYARFVEALWAAFPPGSRPGVREFEDYRSFRTAGPSCITIPVTLVPLQNLTIKHDGDFTIFSGELLFSGDEAHVFGNVVRDRFTDALLGAKFRQRAPEILAGVAKCAQQCDRFAACGSFYLSQKLAEHGTFDAAETLACRLEIKTLHNVLDRLRA